MCEPKEVQPISGKIQELIVADPASCVKDEESDETDAHEDTRLAEVVGQADEADYIPLTPKMRVSVPTTPPRKKSKRTPVMKGSVFQEVADASALEPPAKARPVASSGFVAKVDPYGGKL